MHLFVVRDGARQEWTLAQDPMRTRSLLAGGVLAGVMHAVTATAQQPALNLDSLVARALSTSPRLRAANARVDAARARVRPASTPPDPMLMAGIINQPLGRASEEHTSELQSPCNLVCRLLLEKKKNELTDHNDSANTDHVCVGTHEYHM